MSVVTFDHVDVIFGPDPSTAFAMLDQGADRAEIAESTQNVIAVHDASLEVADGDICVLMGLSGSGKSSLLRCVNGLNKVSRGRVLVRYADRQIDVTSCDRKTLHRLRTDCISMVFQHFALMPWRSIIENVAFGLELSGMSKTERRRIVEEKLEMVRLANWADKYPHQLSGGMQQRVGLARALATDATILLMDEPFSALDPLIREHLQDELIQIQENLKKTIIFVSHDLDEALKLGSSIAIMEAGRIVQIGSPEEIVSNPVNEYVSRFVASMNPIKVLRCASLLRPVRDLKQSENKDRIFELDPAGQCVCRLDSDGRPDLITLSGAALNLIYLQNDTDLQGLPRGGIVMAEIETPMKAVIEINHFTGLPVPVLDSAGKLLGVVGPAEIFRGILRE
ncbi:MAG: choline ABC transporter ATP-binding protein [Deltaproteobacteria bacterium]|nr:choline ABC transporter ATP-binding protein [Deltaproteobacteria bacterium]